MKRAKKIVTLVTIASLALGSAVNVFGAVSPETSTMGAPSTKVPGAVEEQQEVAPVAEMPKVDSEPLKYTEKHYYADAKFEYVHAADDLGVYPVVAGMDALNKKIYDAIWSNYSKFSRDYETSYQQNAIKVSYEVVEEGRYTKIIQTIKYNRKTTDLYDVTDTFNYYIDKMTYTELTEADYEAAIASPAAPAAPVAEEKTEEVLMFKVRDVEKLGYTLTWDAASQTITVSKDDTAVAAMTIGDTKYLFKGISYELEAAPVLQDGSTYVPLTFFTEVLGATATVDANGTYVFTAAE